MMLEPDDEDILDVLAITELVPESEPRRERLNRLSEDGYVVLVNRRRLFPDIPRAPAYRLSVRGWAYIVRKNAGPSPKE